MILQADLTQTTQRSLAEQFFLQTQGRWSSQRRYYTLPNGKIQEISSILEIQYLPQGHEALHHLAQLHHLDDPTALWYGTQVSWDSEESVNRRKQSQGTTVFGIAGTTLYRDRGFATSKPVTAKFYLSNPQTLCLRTEYNNSVFEEEIKLIGNNYRTRQTIISRAGEEQTIGQYLEKRIA
ncbi:phycobiliprotein lyase [Roseofilum casamattae]|uniref:Chromophore lyase CpcS/CpeS n=1 Tax=Roseofilum casamattae BLCC-M143 TaxID=3022442 RepID=A0ABT7BYP7_9CYAN|nr:phycobiliprotein lyase [Roseofilum casamattae]MDJ1183619.1 phycobiliprotein lyase [Roseofilum casamattae BLCC-M143]